MAGGTVKAPRCESRAEGTGTRCSLPDGHACAHRAAQESWPSEATRSDAARQKAESELRQLRGRVEAFFRSIEVDAELPHVRYTSQFLLDDLKRCFPHLRRTPPKITVAP